MRLEHPEDEPQIPLQFARTIQERFEHFHQENPNVYRKMVSLCREVRARGRSQYAVGAIWERLRWHFDMEVERLQGDFKLNDHYRSRYARLIMQQEPDLAGFFEIRELRS